MPPKPLLPPALLTQPFTLAEAHQHGLTSRMLAGKAWRGHLGLDVGSPFPLHLVVAGDLHLDVKQVFLHRTEFLPPVRDESVSPAAAFMAFCSHATFVEAVEVGDWLLHHGHMTLTDVLQLCARESWRHGASATKWVSAWLDGASRSLPESRSRLQIAAVGLPLPRVNQQVRLVGERMVIGDLAMEAWGVLVEYEGVHHQVDRAQYLSDIERYRTLRAHDIEYVQWTKESDRNPIRKLNELHDVLVRRGYPGPPPHFGPMWRALNMPIRDAMRILRRPQ